MKLLALTKGKFAMIDDDQLQRCNEYNWQYLKIGYAATSIGGRKEKQLIYLHHFVYGATVELDHKDRNKLNCQRDNLRPATRSQNCGNHPLQRRNRYGRKGVCETPIGRYMARLAGNHLGTFDSVAEAGDAYDIAAKQYYGEFYGT